MTSSRSLTRRTGTRLVLAAGVLALAAGSAPAFANHLTPAPVIKATSADGGWTKTSTLVTFEYDVPVSLALSSATATDEQNLPVVGQLVQPAGLPKDLIFAPQVALSDSRAPYTLTVIAHGVDQGTAITNTTTVRTFRIDTQAPLAPTAVQPISDQGATFKTQTGSDSPIQVFQGTESITVTGRSSDRGTAANASGIASLTVHFYNPKEQAAPHPQSCQNTPPAGLPACVGSELLKTSAESIQYRTSISVTCPSGVCALSTSYSVPITGLPNGYWNVRISSTDLAGNVSSESDPIKFILAKTA